MTVSDLRRLLQDLPGDMPVLAEDAYGQAFSDDGSPHLVEMPRVKTVMTEPKRGTASAVVAALLFDLIYYGEYPD